MQTLRKLAAPVCALAILALPAVAFADTSFAQLLTQLEQEYQLPSGILWKVALAESGGKTSACGSQTGACGMFQFISSTWLADTKSLYNGQPLDPSLRGNPELAAKAAAYELSVIRTQNNSLISQAKVDPSAGLYLGYFLGAGGERTLLKAYLQSPNQSSCALLPLPCQYNQGIMASRSVADLINWAAQKMSVSGVPSVPGNFECSNGVSYAYSYCDTNASNFLPANTVIPANPYGQSATVFPASASSVVSSAGAGTSVTAQATSVNQTTSASTTSQACAPQYSCSGSTLSYETSACAMQTVQTCQYGCSGNSCAYAPVASSSGSSDSGSGNSAFNIFENLSPAATSAASSLSLNSNIYTIVQGVTQAQENEHSTQTPESIADDVIDGQGTFEQGNNSYFSGTSGPLASLFSQLQVALVGLLAYLRSL